MIRNTLYLGLVATALLFGSRVDAQAGRRGKQGVVIVARGHAAPARRAPGRHVGHPANRYVPPAYRGAPPRRPVGVRPYDSANVRQQRNDLARISDITQSWHRAVRTRNRRAERLADRRLQVWIEAERREARRNRHRGHRYLAELQRLDRELTAQQWRFATARARRPHYAHKARILDELVRLSEQQLFDAKRLGYSAWGMR